MLYINKGVNMTTTSKRVPRGVYSEVADPSVMLSIIDNFPETCTFTPDDVSFYYIKEEDREMAGAGIWILIALPYPFDHYKVNQLGEVCRFRYRVLKEVCKPSTSCPLGMKLVHIKDKFGNEYDIPIDQIMGETFFKGRKGFRRVNLTEQIYSVWAYD